MIMDINHQTLKDTNEKYLERELKEKMKKFWEKRMKTYPEDYNYKLNK